MIVIDHFYLLFSFAPFSVDFLKSPSFFLLENSHLSFEKGFLIKC